MFIGGSHTTKDMASYYASKARDCNIVTTFAIRTIVVCPIVKAFLILLEKNIKVF